MKYLEYVNSLLKNEVIKHDNLVLFGQNISAGSCLGGLTRGLSVKDNGMVINSTNSENTLCGFGFGMMMNGVSSIFFMKQLDFLLLGIDHLVNTYNIIRNMKQGNGSSFTIMPIVVDNGYQGPQSSFNNLPDMCSIARIPGFCISTKWEAEKIIASKLVSPGFRIITVSQRLFKEELPSPEKLYYSNENNTVFQYESGNDATIVCFNFSFAQGYDLYQELKKNNINTSIFNVTSATPTNWDKIIKDVQNTKKLVIIDDSKSQNLSCDALVTDIHMGSDLKKKIIVKRTLLDDWLDPVSDKMEINKQSIINELSN
jgi:pyruvate/2-oxoglutarate/acetoin dehydrogenase E1 component